MSTIVAIRPEGELMTGRQENSAGGRFGSLPAKLLAAVFVLICLAVGVVGLILPIIPGLLFLAVAAMIAARHSPSLDRWLRKNPTIGAYLDSGRGFLNLNWWGKIQYGLWLCLKLFIDTVVLIFMMVTRLLNFAADKYKYYR